MTRLNETFVPFASFIVIKFMTVLITKTALTKLLENTLDENSKLKNMFDERLGCPMKSLLITQFLPDNVRPFGNSFFTPWVRNDIESKKNQHIYKLIELMFKGMV